MGAEKLRIGIDVGGTFTDVVLLGDHPAPLATAKVLNSGASRATRVAAGVRRVLDMTERSPHELSYIAHGTTLTTNAVIERKGARTALITNEGFRDVLEIGRFSRPADLIYDVYGTTPMPLVPRSLRYGLNCRIDRDGNTVREPDEEELQTIIDQLSAEEVEAVAICFLFSFLNPAHEEIVASRVRGALPGVEVLTSSTVMPEFREFPRTSTTVFAAYCAPVLRRYFLDLVPALQLEGVECPVYVYQSNGGIVSTGAVMDNPATTLLSGPAGAVAGVTNISDIGKRSLVTIDIGGTSLDISIIKQGVPELSSSRELMGFPLAVPSLDIRAVGAGGGSVIAVDEVGRVRVGPKSMGAIPGPAAYGRGGTTPTLTDLNVLLGLLDPDYFAGGTEPLFPDQSRLAFEAIARQTNTDVEVALGGVFDVAINQIANSVREMVLERGYDIREFTLVAFGGGGPVYATAVAEALGIASVVVPANPGVFAAAGMASADFIHDSVRSLLVAADSDGVAASREAVDSLLVEAQDRLEAEGVARARQVHAVYFDMRYAGQSTELSLQINDADPGLEPETIARAFGDLHESTYGYSVPDEPTEIVNVRVRSTGRVRSESSPAAAESAMTTAEPRGVRSARLTPSAPREIVNVFRRDDLSSGHVVHGPAVIDEMSSTTVVPADWSATVQHAGSLLIQNLKSSEQLEEVEK